MTPPEHLYDWFARDGRDGEEVGPFDTRAEARKARNDRGAKLDWWMRCCWTVVKRLSEKKIARALGLEAGK